ncbi:MAG: hypothetical protein ACFB9M_08485 [Myxococcota bacterium]
MAARRVVRVSTVHHGFCYIAWVRSWDPLAPRRSPRLKAVFRAVAFASMAVVLFVLALAVSVIVTTRALP